MILELFRPAQHPVRAWAVPWEPGRARGERADVSMAVSVALGPQVVPRADSSVSVSAPLAAFSLRA